jgi:hypothetical protein
MKFLTPSLLAATRKVIELSISIHLAVLKLVVWLSEKEVSKAEIMTDNARAVAAVAKGNLAVAEAAEAAAGRSLSGLRAAANAEARKLRRGAVIA